MNGFRLFVGKAACIECHRGNLLTDFGFTDFEASLSTRPAKAETVGTDEGWAEATENLRAALEAEGLAFEIDEGGGAFYGPKIDVKLKDALGREWQCPTIQVDLNLPKRFGVYFTGPDGQDHEVIMLHRALYGSLERFVGIFIEHTGGEFPVWVAPTQAMIVPVNPKAMEYAEQTAEMLRAAGVRVEVDARDEKLGAKIRDGELQKVPYLIVVGPRDIEAGTCAPRRKGQGDLGTMPREQIVERIREEIRTRAH